VCVCVCARARASARVSAVYGWVQVPRRDITSVYSSFSPTRGFSYVTLPPSPSPPRFFSVQYYYYCYYIIVSLRFNSYMIFYYHVYIVFSTCIRDKVSVIIRHLLQSYTALFTRHVNIGLLFYRSNQRLKLYNYIILYFKHMYIDDDILCIYKLAVTKTFCLCPGKRSLNYFSQY